MLPQDTTQPIPETKRCSKCGASKPLSEFHNNRAQRDGLKYYCKDCESAWRRGYQAANRKRIAERVRSYRAIKREKIAEHVRCYQKENPEKVSARTAIGNAVRVGKLPPASAHFCFVCGISADQDTKMEYHHVDYAKPYEVIPVCVSCHRQWHAKT